MGHLRDYTVYGKYEPMKNVSMNMESELGIRM